jgi:glucan biosynthesis protein C
VVFELTHASVQVYVYRLTHGQFTGSYFQFLPTYYSIGTFDTSGKHLWYLQVLFVSTLLLYPVMRWLKGGGRGLLSRFGDLLALPGAVYVLALPALLMDVLVNPSSPVKENNAGWPYIIYLWLVLAGFLVISNERLQENIRRMRWLSLAVGLVCIGCFIPLYGLAEGPAYGTARFALSLGLRSIGSWCCVLAFLGFGSQYLEKTTPSLKYANEAVLPFYILHQTVLLSVGYFVVQWAIPSLVKWLIILVVSFSIIMILYEFLVRRFNIMRFLFGMKPLVKQPIPRPQEAATASSPGTSPSP